MSSEIIRHHDGSLYHLRTQPHQVSDTIITVGDPGRVPLVSRHFERMLHRVQHREFCTHTGLWQGRPVSVISTGIGTDNIDIVLNELHLLKNYDWQRQEPLPQFVPLTILRLGTSGAIHPSLAVGDTVLSAGALGFDNLLSFYPPLSAKAVELPANWSHPWRPYATRADASLLQHFQATFSRAVNTATLPGFYAPQGRQAAAGIRDTLFLHQLAQWRLEGQPLANLEMETAGIYGLAELLGHRALSVNAILAHRLQGTFAERPQRIIDSMIERSLAGLAAW